MKLNGLEKHFKNLNGEIVDLKQVYKDGLKPLMYALIYNKSQELNLNERQWDYLIKNSDLKQINKLGQSPLMYAFMYNKSENINLSNEHFDYLIKNSDLKQVATNNCQPLIYALNKSKNLNLSHENWKYLIDNSDLSLITDKYHLMVLKKIQSYILTEEILSKIDIKENINKKLKI